MKRFALLYAAVTVSLATVTAQLNTPRASALGQAAVAARDVWGAGQNPAAVPGSEARPFAVQAYGRTLTTVDALTQVGIDARYRLNNASVGVGVQHFSPPGYAQTALHASVQRVLAKDLTAGLRLGVVLGDYDEYGSETLPVVQLGVQYRVSGKLRAGAHYTYAERPILPLAEHRLRIGIDYASSERVHLLLAAIQPVDNRLAAGFGVVFRASDRFRLNAGVQTGGTAFTFGLEAALRNGLGLALTAVAYQELPLSVDYGISYE